MLGETLLEQLQRLPDIARLAAGFGVRRKREPEGVLVPTTLELVDLGYKRDALVTSLSRGMTQRLGLARVLLHEPQVLLLDEPASGLDPRSRVELRDLLRALAAHGVAVLVSSHLMAEMSLTASHLVVIGRGRLIADTSVDEFVASAGGRQVLVRSPDGRALRAALH